jgi:hypothetical protein
MRSLIALSLSVLLGLTSCIATPPDTLPTDGAIGSLVHRVVVRHDNYVLGDAALAPAASDAALAESAALETIVGLPEVLRSSLAAALAPVAARHDAYVRGDAALDELERETYLASTDGLRRLAGVK